MGLESIVNYVPDDETINYLSRKLTEIYDGEIPLRLSQIIVKEYFRAISENGYDISKLNGIRISISEDEARKYYINRRLFLVEKKKGKLIIRPALSVIFTLYRTWRGYCLQTRNKDVAPIFGYFYSVLVESKR